MSVVDVRLAQAVRLVREVADDERGEAVPEALLGGLNEIFPCVCVCFAELDPRNRRLLSFQSTSPALPHDWAKPEWNARFWRLCLQMGPMRHIWDGAFDPGDVLLLTDFTPARVLANTEMFRDYFRPNGERFTAAVPLPAPPAQINGFFFFRWDRDFSEGERDLLTLLYPHLAAIRAAHRRRGTGIPALTARQRQVLRCLAQGRTTEQTAAAMCVSTCTVRKHLENIYERLGVSSRAAAIGMTMLDPEARP